MCPQAAVGACQDWTGAELSGGHLPGTYKDLGSIPSMEGGWSQAGDWGPEHLPQQPLGTTVLLAPGALPPVSAKNPQVPLADPSYQKPRDLPWKGRQTAASHPPLEQAVLTWESRQV